MQTTKIVLGTWNAGALNKSGQLENTKQEMFNPNVNILALCETKWANNRNFVIERHEVIYAGRKKNEKGIGLILDKNMKKCVLKVCQLFKRIIAVKLKGKPF